MSNKFKKGDDVRFLNDTGGGIISRIDHKGIVYVLSEDGFEIPVKENELVFAGNFTQAEARQETEQVINKVMDSKEPIYNKAITEKSVVPGQVAYNSSVNLILGFIAEEPGPVFTSRLLCYLINDSKWYAYYSVGIKEKGIVNNLASGIIEPETKYLLKAFDQASVSKISDIHVQAIWVSSGKYVPVDPVNEMINIHTINFTKESYYHVNEYFDEDALLISITGRVFDKLKQSIDVPDEVKELKKNADKPSKEASKKKEPIEDTIEVDLHSEAFDIDYKKYDSGKILELQMKKFHEAIKEASDKKMKKLILIHGIGQGILKTQIRKELQEKYPQYSFQDASFKEYGFGATMVYLTYKN